MDKQEESKEVKLSSQEDLALQEGELVWAVMEMPGFKQVIRPFLEAKLNQSFPDPTKIAGEGRQEQFLYEATVASLYKKIVAELLQWFDAQVEQAKHLQKKKRGEIKSPFAIGGE